MNLDQMRNTPVPTTQSVGVLIDNPFNLLKEINPTEWDCDVFQSLMNSSRPGILKTANDFILPESDEIGKDLSFYAKDIVNLIAEAEEVPASDREFYIQRIPVILSKLLPWLKYAKEMPYSVEGIRHGTLLYVAEEQWPLTTLSGCRVAELPIFRYTNSICRQTWREKQTVPPGERWIQYLDYPPQDDGALDPLDLAVLISMAQEQKELDLQADEYTVYVLYPNSTLEELFVLKATIPLQTLEAIEREDEKMPPMRLEQGKVPIDVDGQQPLQHSELVKLLASFMDHALEIAKTLAEESSDSASSDSDD